MSKVKVLLGFSLTFCLLFTYAARLAADDYRYTAHKTTEAIHVDGKLDEGVWAKAQTITLSHKEGGAPVQPTEVRVLWDNYYIYFSWDCVDSHIWSTMTVRDLPLYNEEVVEVFIDADGNGSDYVELEVNPLGTLWDGFIINRGFEGERVKLTGILAWNSLDIRWAAWPRGTVNDSTDTDQGWSAEMAVPLADFVTARNNPPRDGDRWRVNFFRIDLPHGAGQRGEGQSWSPVGPGTFHKPDKFGTLIFSSDLVP